MLAFSITMSESSSAESLFSGCVDVASSELLIGTLELPRNIIGVAPAVDVLRAAVTGSDLSVAGLGSNGMRRNALLFPFGGLLPA